MNFKEFKKWVKDNIKDYLPEEMKTKKIVIHKVSVLSGDYTGITLRSEDQTIAPTANLELFFGEYEKGVSKEAIIRMIAGLLCFAPDERFSVEMLDDYSYVKDKLFVRVCNAEVHEELLRDVPHLAICDLAVTCHVFIAMPGNPGSVIINNSMLETYGISKKQLFIDAFINATKIMPVTKGIVSGVSEKADEAAPEGFCFLTNEKRCYGACTLFYPGVAEEMAEKYGDFFAVPSSVHEMLIVPKSVKNDAESIRKVLVTMNNDDLNPGDFLSNNIYEYDPEGKIIRIA